MTAEAASFRWEDEPAKPAPSEQLADADLVRVYLNEIGKHPLLNAEQEVEHAKTMEAGLFAEQKLAQHFESIAVGGEPLLTVEELELLPVLAAEGRDSKRIMLESNLRLVVSIAKRYKGRGMPLLDLIQEGNMGLIRGVEKFDYTKGFKFSTYASWWIRQAITRAMADQGRTIRLPVHMVEQVNKVGKIQRELLQELGHEPTIEEVAKRAQVSPEKVQELLDYSRDPVSMDAVIDDEGSTRLSDFIEDADAVDPSEYAAQSMLVRELQLSLEMFTQGGQVGRNLNIILRYYGFYGTKETYEDIAQSYGLSRERVRQIIIETLKTIRTQRPDLADYLD